MIYSKSDMKSPTPSKKVLVLLSRADLTHRNHLNGVLEYMHKNVTPRWSVQLGLRENDGGYPKTETLRNYDGVIAIVNDMQTHRSIVCAGIPAVLFEPEKLAKSAGPTPENVVTFLHDFESQGESAAEYFLSRGYVNFAYVGTFNRTLWSEGRKDGFVSRLSAEGFSAHIYKPPKNHYKIDFSLEIRRLSRWISKLPQRTAIFVAHDERAREVIFAIKNTDRSIPEDIAVLGVDNDELLCSTFVPSISSIDVNSRSTGVSTAKALEAIFNGTVQEKEITIKNTHIITRRSTDAFSLNDPFLSRALSYASANLSSKPHLDEIAAAAKCSKRTLEIHSRAVFGRTFKEELSAMQVQEATRRLCSHDANPAQVARATGFCNTSHMYRRIRLLTHNKCENGKNE